MSALYLISGIVALSLLVYLILALLKPEWFG
jgi:K+-transporting ATPase KdpF subunit